MQQMVKSKILTMMSGESCGVHSELGGHGRYHRSLWKHRIRNRNERTRLDPSECLGARQIKGQSVFGHSHHVEVSIVKFQTAMFVMAPICVSSRIPDAQHMNEHSPSIRTCRS